MSSGSSRIAGKSILAIRDVQSPSLSKTKALVDFSPITSASAAAAAGGYNTQVGQVGLSCVVLAVGMEHCRVSWKARALSQWDPSKCECSV